MKKKISPSFRKAVIAMTAVAALAGILFGIRAVVNSKKSVGVVSVMSIADTWYDYGSTGYGQISQGGTQQVWADRSMLISKVYVSEGDHVQKGDPLMQYDVTQARLQEDSCRIEYEMAARDLRRAEERLSYIRTFRPNERPEPLRMIYTEPVDITKDEEGRLLIISGKESVEEFIDKDGVYGITININCSTPITRRTFETLLSYDPRAELPHPDDEVPVIPYGPDDPGQSPAGEDTQDPSGEHGADPSGDSSPDPSGGTDGQGDKDKEGKDGEEGKIEVIPQMNFTFVIWEHYGDMDSVRIASVHANPEEDGIARKRWLETVLPVKEDEQKPDPDQGSDPGTDPVPDPDLTLEPDPTPDPKPEPEPDPVYFFSTNYSVDGMTGAVEEKVDDIVRGVFIFCRERANAQVPETERYTKEQIDSMIVEQNRLIREYRIAVSQAELDWKKAGQTASDGVVRADHDGIVVSVGSIYSGKSDEPLISVSSGNGYQIMSTLTELQLGTVKVGDEISVSMWSNGQTYSGRIVRISPYPTSDNMGYSYNPNTSNYVFIADLECEDELQPWDGGEIQFLSDQQGSKGMFALEACFVREEGGRNYVLKAGDDGRLEKQYVEVGRILYGGWSVEIISGLGMEDYIAFPYGKNAVEGARADYESGVMAW